MSVSALPGAPKNGPKIVFLGVQEATYLKIAENVKNVPTLKRKPLFCPSNPSQNPPKIDQKSMPRAFYVKVYVEHPLETPPGAPRRPSKTFFNIKVKFWASSWRPRRTQEALQILLKIDKIRVWGQDGPGTPPDPQKHRKMFQHRPKNSPKSYRKSYQKCVKKCDSDA